jgi:hypothetical protein
MDFVRMVGLVIFKCRDFKVSLTIYLYMTKNRREKSIYSICFEDFIRKNKIKKVYVANILNMHLITVCNLLKKDGAPAKSYANKVILYNFLSGYKLDLWNAAQEVQTEYTHTHIKEYDLTDIWSGILHKYNLSLSFVAQLMHMDIKMVYRKGIIRKGRNSRNKITQIRDVNLLLYRYLDYIKTQLKLVDIELLKLDFKVY